MLDMATARLDCASHIRATVVWFSFDLMLAVERALARPLFEIESADRV